MAKAKDPELAAMSKIGALLAELEPDVRNRVIAYLIRRYADVQPGPQTSPG